MLRASLANPSDAQVEEAKTDLSPWLARFAERVQQEQEVAAWSEADVAPSDRGVDLDSEGGWEDKRQAEMLRSNPNFVLRQWVLEELIAKLEETGVERIEEGRMALAKVLDVSPICCPPSASTSVDADELRCRADRSSIGTKWGQRRNGSAVSAPKTCWASSAAVRASTGCS